MILDLHNRLKITGGSLFFFFFLGRTPHLFVLTDSRNYKNNCNLHNGSIPFLALLGNFGPFSCRISSSEILVNIPKTLSLFKFLFLSVVDSSFLYSWILACSLLQSYRIHSSNHLLRIIERKKIPICILDSFIIYSPLGELNLSRLNLLTCLSFRIRNSFLAFFV